MDEEVRAAEKGWRADPGDREGLRRFALALRRAQLPLPDDVRASLALPVEVVERLRAAHEDDAPRLELATWYSTIDDPRGELIAAQVALSGRVPWSERVGLRRAAARLLAEHGATWAARVRPLTADVWFHRGFVRRVTTALPRFLGAAGQAALDAEPITDAVLTGATPDLVRQLAASPALGRLRRLTLRGGGLDAALPALAASPHLRLVALNLGGCGVGPAGVAALARADGLRGLRRLALTRNRIGDEGARALAGSYVLGSLEALFLSASGVGSGGARALASGGLRGLRHLALNRNGLADDVDDDEEGDDLSAALRGGLPHLRRLELRD